MVFGAATGDSATPRPTQRSLLQRKPTSVARSDSGRMILESHPPARSTTPAFPGPAAILPAGPDRKPVTNKNGAGGIRTPVPDHPRCRLYVCVPSFNLGVRVQDGHRLRTPSPQKCLTSTSGDVPLRPARSLQAARYRASCAARVALFRQPERSCCWLLILCILFTWPACSRTRVRQRRKARSIASVGPRMSKNTR